MVAVKALKVGCGSQLSTGWRREIDILRMLSHENIVKYKGCCEDQGGRGQGGILSGGGAGLELGAGPGQLDPQSQAGGRSLLGTEMRMVGLPPFYLRGRSARAKMGGSHCQLRVDPSHRRTGPSMGVLAFLPHLGVGDSRVGYPWSLPLSPSGEKSVQLVMEYVPLGSLRDYLPRHSVGLAQLLLFAQQICEVGRPAPATYSGLSVTSLCLPDPAYHLATPAPAGLLTS